MGLADEPSKRPEPESDGEVDWSDYVYEEQKPQSDTSLDVKDYMALFIAALETIFFPLVVIGIILVVLALIFNFM